MQLIQDFLFLSVNELVSYGVPIHSIRQGTNRYRQKKSKAWICRKDPHDRRKILILYKAIPTASKKKYQIPSEADLLEKYKQQQLEEKRLQKALSE